MSLIESNSTKLLLPQNGVYQGRAVRPDVKYITIQITATFEGGNSGLLEVYYSIDGIFYDNFGDSWTYTTLTNEAHIFKETQMKGSFFYVKWTNNGISAYTSFNLNTKLAETTSTVSVDGVVNIPEVNVNIEGQTVFSKIRDTAGNALNSIDGRLNVDISGQRVVTDISGQRVVTDISGQRVDISGQRVVTDISGQRIVTDISGQRVDISGQRVVTDISGQRVVTDISGQTLVVNTISGFATSALQTTGNNLLTDIKNKTLDSNADSVTVYAGGENGLNIRYLASNIDSVDVGLSTYAWSNSNPPFPATRDVLGAQLCGVNNLAGDSLINLVSNSEGSLKVDISGQRVITDISGQRVLTDISGQRVVTDISGQRVITDISGQRVDISGQRLVVNTITGYATDTLQTAGNTSLADIKTNSDKLKYVGDDLKAVISNTSFESKLRDGNNNVITSTVYGIDGVRGLDVSIKNATQAEPLNVVIDPTNVINTFSTNLPASYPIDAGGALSSALGALNVNLRNTDGNAIGITGTPLVVESNLITGFALESGGNLASIKTNTDKFKFTGDYLKTEINASLTNPLIVEELNPITGYALETGGNLASIKTNTDKNTYDPSGNLKVNLASGSITVDSVNIKASNGDSLTATGTSLNTNITNSSIDTHCYGSSDGTTWHHLKTTGTGNLITESKTHDGTNNPISSTVVGEAKRALDVNVANTGALKVDISGSSIVDGYLIVADTIARPFIERISVGSGADIFSYAFGNFLNNTTINTGAVSTTISFGGAGIYGRRAMLMYRDTATSSTDSITYYTDSNFGTPEPLLLQTVYPIVNSGYRWSNVIINILPFTNIKIRNDSTTINNTNVYLTIVRV